MLKEPLSCILLIDDDDPTNFLNKMTIGDSGCTREIWVEQSAAEALDQLSELEPEKLPELIFLDLNMPAMDGWEFMEGFAALPIAQNDSIKVIVLTTSTNPEDELRARKMGVIDDFRIKPLTTPMLENILKVHFPDRV